MIPDVSPALPNTLRRTALYDRHAALNARIVPFSGWEMPVQYSGITKEHEAVRQRAGLFDISHMGKFCFRGKNLLQQLQKLVPTDLSQLTVGAAQYTVLLNPSGGIIDDLIFYDQGFDAAGDQQMMAIVNAATTQKDKDWFLAHLDAAIHLEDRSELLLLAIQGPEAATALQPFVQADLSTVQRFGHTESQVMGGTGFLARTGYTGEDGFEVMLDAVSGLALWEALLAAGVLPCGLGARDTLRLEAAMALYGQDIDDGTTPLEAGLGWLVQLERVGEFVGREVLLKQKQAGMAQRLVGLQMTGRNIARHDYSIWQGGNPIGKITSGSLSPTLGYPIALGYVPTEFAKLGQILEVEIRGKLFPATVVKRPFYKSAG